MLFAQRAGFFSVFLLTAIVNGFLLCLPVVCAERQKPFTLFFSVARAAVRGFWDECAFHAKGRLNGKRQRRRGQTDRGGNMKSEHGARC